jgi:hypothetical protein
MTCQGKSGFFSEVLGQDGGGRGGEWGSGGVGEGGVGEWGSEREGEWERGRGGVGVGEWGSGRGGPETGFFTTIHSLQPANSEKPGFFGRSASRTVKITNQSKIAQLLITHYPLPIKFSC